MSRIGEKPSMPRIAAYIRFSTSGQAREESFESLLFQVRKAVEQIGGKFEDCKVFRDVMSGRRTDRPGFQELLALIRAKAVDIVVVRGDRLSRDVQASSELAKLLEKYDVRFWDIIKGRFIDFSNPEDWADYHRAAVDHEKESRTISKRIRMRKEFARHQGKVQGGRMPLGYRRSKDGFYEVDPDTKDAARRIFQLFIETRSSITTARLIFEEMGIDMTYQAIRKMVTKPVYRGHTGYLQKRTTNKKQKGQGQSLSDLDFTVILPNTHEALIDEEMWRQVQDVLGENKRRRGRTKFTACLPLSGLTWCDRCGAPGNICNWKTERNGRVYALIYCADYRRGKAGKGCGDRKNLEAGTKGKVGKVGLRIDVAEAAVIEALCNRAEQLAQEVINTPDENSPVTEAQVRIEMQIAQIEGLISSIGDESGLLRQKIAELKAQIPKSGLAEQEDLEELRSVLVRVFRNPEVWETLQPGERKTLFRQLVNRVTFDFNRVVKVELKI